MPVSVASAVIRMFFTRPTVFLEDDATAFSVQKSVERSSCPRYTRSVSFKELPVFKVFDIPSLLPSSSFISANCLVISPKLFSNRLIRLDSSPPISRPEVDCIACCSRKESCRKPNSVGSLCRFWQQRSVICLSSEINWMRAYNTHSCPPFLHLAQGESPLHRNLCFRHSLQACEVKSFYMGMPT